MGKIDYAKLLGFNAVSQQLSDGVDFQDETIGAKLGAKVGPSLLHLPSSLRRLRSNRTLF